MRLRGHDQAFVGVAPGLVYGALADPAGYGRWWPGASPGGLAGTVRLPLGRGRPEGRAEGHRESVGLHVTLPALDGSLEWFLEPFDDGTMVNALLDVELRGGPRRAARLLLGLRTSLRRALTGLKRELEERP